MLGPAFGRTDFSRIFIFGPPDFFADFLAGFFLLIFVGKSARKILQENPRENPPKFIQQKSSNTFLQIGRGKICSDFFRTSDLLSEQVDQIRQPSSFCRPLRSPDGLLLHKVKKAHRALRLGETAADPGTTSRLTRRKFDISWVPRRNHKLSYLVSQSVVPGSTGLSPEREFFVRHAFQNYYRPI